MQRSARWLAVVVGICLLIPSFHKAVGEPAVTAPTKAAAQPAVRPQTKQPTTPPARPTRPAPSWETSYRGALPELSDRQKVLRYELRYHVDALASKIGERNVNHYDRLAVAATYIDKVFSKVGYKVGRQTYQAGGRDCQNLEVELQPAPAATPRSGLAPAKQPTGKIAPAKPREIVIVGAHYDSANGSPGANDNASGMAALMCLSWRFAHRPRSTKLGARTLCFVAFVNEESPYFQTDQMGSLVYARRCRQRQENIVAVLSLETIGYYSDAVNSQRYPPFLSAAYPSTGNFIGFVGNIASRPLIDRVTTSFRRHARFPSEKGAMPDLLPGVGWSDHWSFWHEGYPGVMVTDTAFYRYPHYHRASDTPDKLDYDRLARVVDGLVSVVAELVEGDESRPAP